MATSKSRTLKSRFVVPMFQWGQVAIGSPLGWSAFGVKPIWGQTLLFVIMRDKLYGNEGFEGVSMARPLRIEFEGAIYHVTARGNARQTIVKADDDRQRLRDGLDETVLRYGWELLSFVFMNNHLHLFFRTPQPNLSAGMQYFLSGYANWFSRRHQRPGHLFQGRFKAKLVENESYFWQVSRYIHLNPFRTRPPLATRLRDWPWSSYPGFARQRDRVEWVAYDLLLSAWRGQAGGTDPGASYRRFVEAGIKQPPPDPFRDAVGGWILGGVGSEKDIHPERETQKCETYTLRHT